MVKVLIPTMADDSHAVYVKLALEHKGHNSVLFYTADYPELQTHSFELNKNRLTWKAQGEDLEINDDQFDVLWYRRATKPMMPDYLHPDDKENAEKETNMLFHSLWQVIAPDARWINPVNNAKIANSKLLQLKIANQLGLKLPETLISNNPEKIREFINHHGDGNVIYKPLHTMFWFKGSDMRGSYTRKITNDVLPTNTMLQATPGIFQQHIPKAYELRITYFGDYPVTAKLKSQEHPKGVMDWRYVPINELDVEPYTLPEQINAKCRAMLKKLGLVFGCFDFIVTPTGEYYFLEVNEAGQFLWIEEYNPDIKMLDIFTEYLIHGDISLYKKSNTSAISMPAFRSQVESFLTDALKRHKNKNLFN